MRGLARRELYLAIRDRYGNDEVSSKYWDRKRTVGGKIDRGNER